MAPAIKLLKLVTAVASQKIQVQFPFYLNKESHAVINYVKMKNFVNIFSYSLC